MATYVLSDIHGHYSEFMKMLEKIKFSENDTLYILGDVIDRGNENLKIIDYIMEHKNVVWLMGNHEDMMLSYYRTRSSWDLHLWEKNGGHKTREELEQVSEEKFKEYLEVIKNLPTFKMINVNDEDYLLVHAGFIYPFRQTNLTIEEMAKHQRDNILWVREDFLNDEIETPFKIIFGHTPIVYYDYYLYDMTEEMKKAVKKSEIVKWDNKIGIDCGCAAESKLGCIRLDDMKEFYVKCGEGDK